MPDDETDDSNDEATRFSSVVDDGIEDDDGAIDFGDGDEPASGHSESVFVVDDEMHGRESWLRPSTADLEAAEARAAFAEAIADPSLAEQLVAPSPEAIVSDNEVERPYVDADPSAMDADAGLSPQPTGEPPQGDVARRHLRGLLEALLFVSEKPMKVADLAEVARADNKECRAILEELAAQYRNDGRGFQLDELAGGWQLRTSAAFAPFVRELTAQKPVKLTRAQVETLAIVAYRQPITRPEVEDIRGVDAGAVLKLLLDRDLVRVLGKKDEPGRPLLYGTTSQFLTFFGLKSLRDLPTLREFTELSDESREVVERELGEVLPEGPKEPAPVIGDASVAAADFDPEAPPPPAPMEEPAVSAPSNEGLEEERAAHEEPAEEDAAEEAADEEDEGASEEKPGGSNYDPSDEELYPDDDDEDFDDDDEDEEDDDEDDEEDGDDEEGE